VDRDGGLNLAVVGLGEFGRRYLQALEKLPGVTIAWVCDRDEERCRQAAERFRVPRWATEMAPLCDDSALDAVVVVTPEAAHRAVAIAALEAGKHVLVEKPLATKEEDALAMIAAAERAERRLIPAFLLRFDYRYAQVHQRLPLVEPVRTIYAHRNFDRRLFELYSRTHSFVENAIHDIDLILWYVKSPVKRVHGFCRNTLGLANPDVNWGVLEFENGVLAVLQTTWLYPAQPHEFTQWNAGIQIMGEHGVLEVANDAGGFRVNADETGIVLLDQTAWADIHGEPRGAFGAMLRNFVASLRGDNEYHGATSADALEAMRVARRLVEDSERAERSM
jgi:predicted dehydrogenase